MTNSNSNFKIALTALTCLLAEAAYAQTTLQFSLPQDATTSAGAYSTNGTLIRTLWRGVPYVAGAHTATWDGKDDNGQTVPAGTYELRVLSHNMRYTWEGAIGNTSTDQFGSRVLKGFMPLRDMTATDTAIYYVTGYNEGQSNVHRMRQSNTRVQANIGRVDAFVAPALTDTDGTNLYIANNEGGVLSGTKTSFVYAQRVRDNAEVVFAAGKEVWLNNTYPDQHYPSVIDFDQTSPPVTGAFIPTGVMQNAASGLAVQRNGQILAVAHRGLNTIRLFDKTSGVLLRSIVATSPGSLGMTPAGDLWAVVGNSVVRYTNLSTNPTIASTINGLTHPLAVGTDPTDENIVLVADGGSSQQVKAFSRTGTPYWIYGQAGGYPALGSEVRNDKFWFDNTIIGETTFVTILPDHSFWVGDAANSRSLHFSADRDYLGQIMFQPHSYAMTVDANDPTRVFNEFLEFKVDYSKPVGESWTLVRNWRAGLPSRYLGFFQGLRQAVTFPNGRTYCVLRNFTTLNGEYMELAELGGNFLRPTGIRPARTGDEAATIRPDGSLYLAPFNPASGTTASWYSRALTGYDGSGNPQWGSPATLASTPVSATDPVARVGGFGEVMAPVTSSGVLATLDYSKNNGWHLGGLKVGGTQWLWKASPTGPLDGKGSYAIDNGVQYSGNVVMATGRHILYGFHGEFWKDAQASQVMHFYDDGLFVGQFGETTLGHTAAEGVLRGAAGNGVSPTLTVVNGETYLWLNDEGGHGPQRWHLLGLNTVQEATGTGPLNSTIALNLPNATSPRSVVATPGNQQVRLAWQAVPGATSYLVRYSTTSGGLSTTVNVGATTSYTVSNLANGTYYYFMVVPQLASGIGPASAEVEAAPADPNVLVHFVGHQSSNYTTFAVSSAAPASGQAAVQLQPILRYLPEPMPMPQAGSQGYVIYNWGGLGVDKVNVRAPFTVTKGAGWRDNQFDNKYLKFQFAVDGTLGSDAGLYSNPAGQINIGVSDDAWHYLTVCSPVRFADPRHFSVSLAPKDKPTMVARYVVGEEFGQNHIFQFRFKGNVTLTVDNGTGAGGTLQAIFLDNAPVLSQAPGGTLPVKLTAFAAERRTADALLTWDTASETGNAYFGVESSTDGTTFRALGQVAGRGSTAQGQHYEYTDRNLARYGTSVVYYRLRQVDTDGTEAFSPVRTVQLASATSFDVQAWPNPSSAGTPLTLSITTPELGLATLQLTDTMGHALWKQQVQLSQGTTTLNFPQAAALPKGLYLLQVQQAASQRTIKLSRE